MIIATLLVVVLVGIFIRTWRPLRTEFDGRVGLGMIAIVWALILLIYLVPVLALIPLEGIDGTYSEGERIGYVTKLSQKGFFWKTFEGEMQSGAGEQASLQNVYAFSVRDPQILKKLKESMGKNVTLKYRQWVCMPYRVGSSGYEIVGVDLR